MASDTATLDLERIQAEARRLRGDEPALPLGPEDRAPDVSGTIELDPATRAHLIVQEVLAAAAVRESTPVPAVEVPAGTDSLAAATARRIVEEVLAAAEAAAPVPTTEPDAATPTIRTDVVLLGLDQPTVLVPGMGYAASPAPFVPTRRPPLAGMIDVAVAPLTRGAPRVYVEPDDTAASQDLRSAIQKAASSDGMHVARWIVAGAIWAVSFAVLVPVLMSGFVASVDLTVDLWGTGGTEQTTVVEQPASP